jgi:hypothetical protein
MSGTTASSVRDVPLRAAVLTLELAAAASIGIAHLVPWPAVGGTAVALVAAAVTSGSGTSGRRWGSPACCWPRLRA